MRLLPIVTALLTALLAVACAHGPAAGPAAAAAERAALERREAGFMEALSARDAERIATFFTEDAVLHVADMPPIRGREAIGRFYGNVFRFMSASTPTPESLRLSAGADMAYSLGRVTTVFHGDPAPVEYTGKFLLVWERPDGEWSVAVYSLSSDGSDRER